MQKEKINMSQSYILRGSYLHAFAQNQKKKQMLDQT